MIIIVLTHCFWLNHCFEGNTIIVALLDTEIDTEKIEKDIWVNDSEVEDGLDNDKNGYIDDINGYDFINDTGRLSSCMQPRSAHATTCAKMILKSYESFPHRKCNILIMPIIVVDHDDGREKESVDKLVEGIKYAEKNGAKICNLSLSTSTYSKELYKCMKESSMLFVVSAGNGTGRGRNIDRANVYPACFNIENQITVSAINEDGVLCINSNYGANQVDVAAYGGYIDESYGHTIYGTSFASARCSGVIAALSSSKDSEDPCYIKKVFLDYTIDNPKLNNRVKNRKEIEPYAQIIRN